MIQVEPEERIRRIVREPGARDVSSDLRGGTALGTRRSCGRGVAPIRDDESIARLRGGSDIVVCSEDRRANRNKACELTIIAFGDFEEDPPHDGRMALPHFHPKSRNPEVHAFFDSPPRHAKKTRKTS